MRRLALFLCLSLSVAPALAVGNLGEVQIRDRATGRFLPVYQSGGRWFVAGKPGNEYRVEVRNGGAGDILAVVSVDGVNVVTGETASPSQSGYVIERSRSLSVSGWRKSLDNVAAFYFTDLADSYASRTGRPENVGVIGVALFRRKPEPVSGIEAPSMAKEADSAAGASRADTPQAARKSIGTGHGRSEPSHARYVQFERETDAPAEVIAIHYDTYANLVARGIIREDKLWPAPFPGGFVPDPPSRG